MMKLSRQSKFGLAIGAQLLVILVIILFKMSVLTGGTIVQLRIAPVDPRDPLRGDYATFQYDISRLDFTLPDPIVGDQVYVMLEKGYGGIWDVVGVQKFMPPDGRVFLKGRVLSQSNGQLQLHYGIEEYFIPEGKGTSLGRVASGSDTYATVAIDDQGNAVLKSLTVDGKPWP